MKASFSTPAPTMLGASDADRKIHASWQAAMRRIWRARQTEEARRKNRLRSKSTLEGLRNAQSFGFVESTDVTFCHEREDHAGCVGLMAGLLLSAIIGLIILIII